MFFSEEKQQLVLQYTSKVGLLFVTVATAVETGLTSGYFLIITFKTISTPLGLHTGFTLTGYKLVSHPLGQ